ncbi:MAG TPA: phosphoribosyltransferase [Gemmatimonadaceae bacterium]
MPRRFTGRTEAGRELALRLAHLRDLDPIVLALPRGGLPVAHEIARSLRAPLDVLIVRKLGVPWHPELAMGAIATGGVRALNDDVIAETGVTEEELEAATARERAELDRRERVYRAGRPAPALRGRTVVLVDDGIATGATVRAAIAVVRAQDPARLVLAVPVVQASIAIELSRDVDEIACVLAPRELFAIGAWYDSFPQLADEDVRATLDRAAAEQTAREHAAPARALDGGARLAPS